MTNESIFEQYYHQLRQIAKAFYQSSRLTGGVTMSFGIRAIADSDGNSVVDVYMSPIDIEASNTMVVDETAKHMQFLENMVPAAVMGYKFSMKLIPEGMEDLRLELINVTSPVAS